MSEYTDFVSFRDDLARPDDATQYQILLINEWRWFQGPGVEFIDALGLILDLPPAIWYLLLTRKAPEEEASDTRENDIPCSSAELEGILEIGDHLLLIVRPSSHRRFWTGI